MNVLALIAHPDDLEIAAAGTICRLTEDKHRVLIGVVTDEADPEIKAIRRAEALRSAETMGVPASQVLFLCQPDRFASNSRNSRALLDNWMQSQHFIPDIVITHSNNDTHQDHRAVRQLALSATNNSASVYLFAAVINSLLQDEFQPTVFVDTQTFWAQKLKALSCYTSQDALGRIRCTDIDQHERSFAREIGLSRVEAFEASFTNDVRAQLLLKQFALLSPEPVTIAADKNAEELPQLLHHTNHQAVANHHSSL